MTTLLRYASSLVLMAWALALVVAGDAVPTPVWLLVLAVALAVQAWCLQRRYRNGR